MKRYYHDADSIQLAAYFIAAQANPLYFSRKIPTLEKLLMAREPAFVSAGQTNCLNAIYGLLGSIYKDRGNLSAALSYYKKALQANRLIQYRAGSCSDLTDIAILYAKGYRQYNRGLAYCDTALNYADSPADSLAVLKEMANMYSQQATGFYYVGCFVSQRFCELSISVSP